MTQKQKTASQRNWLKARLLGDSSFYRSTNPNAVTEDEQLVLDQINMLRHTILESWEVNSRQLGMKTNIRKKET